MSAVDARFGGIGALGDTLTGLLQTPAVIEAVIAGASAFAASRRDKNKDAGGTQGALGGVLDLLPQMLPLIGMLYGGNSAAAPTSGESKDEPAALEVLESAGEDDAVFASINTEDSLEDLSEGSGAFDAANTESKPRMSPAQENREQLLLAIKPFLSESRRSAADAMISVNRVSGLFDA